MNKRKTILVNYYDKPQIGKITRIYKDEDEDDSYSLIEIEHLSDKHISVLPNTISTNFVPQVNDIVEILENEETNEWVLIKIKQE